MPDKSEINFRHELFDFVLDKADEEATQRRIRLYRALAAYAGNPKEAAELNAIADVLESADQACREFVVRFTDHQR